MIVSIHQPAYLPWLGYFHKILRSDVFVFLDTVQLEKNGFANRNRVRTRSGVRWLTVPLLIKGHMGRSIRGMQINRAAGWQRKHLRTMEQAYRNRPHYDRYAAEIGAPVLPCNLCGSQPDTRRQAVKALLASLEQDDPRIKDNLFAALAHVRPASLFDRALSKQHELIPL